MNDPTSRPSAWAQRRLRAMRRCRASLGRWRQVVRWLIPLGHWTTLVRGAVWAGVSLQPDRWQLALHEPQHKGLSPNGRGRDSDGGGLQHRLWRQVSLPDLDVSQDLTVGGSLQDIQRRAWWSALAGIRDQLPPDACHLVLSWPDASLWSVSVTLPGPLTAAELPAVLEQELESLMPAPPEHMAWDVQWPSAPSAPRSSGRWARWLRQRVERMTPVSTHWDDGVTVRCWAMPLAWARQLHAMSNTLGFASLSIEPHSVSLARASIMPFLRVEEATAVRLDEADPPSRVVAFGAACRDATGGPDLLRHLRAVRLHGWRHRLREWWPWGLWLGMAAGMGHLAGGWQAERWSLEREMWEQRLRQLQAVQAAQAQHRSSVRQARAQLQQQEERLAHNLRFAQTMQGWAATVPSGVRWQHLSLRPDQLDLQAQALDADHLTRWMSHWPSTMPAGGQHQLQWQPSPVGSRGSQVNPAVSLSVQWSWGPGNGARE